MGTTFLFPDILKYERETNIFLWHFLFLLYKVQHSPDRRDGTKMGWKAQKEETRSVGAKPSPLYSFTNLVKQQDNTAFFQRVTPLPNALMSLQQVFSSSFFLKSIVSPFPSKSIIKFHSNNDMILVIYFKTGHFIVFRIQNWRFFCFVLFSEQDSNQAKSEKYFSKKMTM